MNGSFFIILGIPVVTTVLAAQCASRLVRDNQSSALLGFVLSLVMFVGLFQTSWIERILSAMNSSLQPDSSAILQASRFILIPVIFGSLVLTLFSALVERSTGSASIGGLLKALRPAIIGAFIVFSFSRAAEFSSILSSVTGG